MADLVTVPIVDQLNDSIHHRTPPPPPPLQCEGARSFWMVHDYYEQWLKIVVLNITSDCMHAMRQAGA